MIRSFCFLTFLVFSTLSDTLISPANAFERPFPPRYADESDILHLYLDPLRKSLEMLLENMPYRHTGSTLVFLVPEEVPLHDVSLIKNCLQSDLRLQLDQQISGHTSVEALHVLCNGDSYTIELRRKIENNQLMSADDFLRLNWISPTGHDFYEIRTDSSEFIYSDRTKSGGNKLLTVSKDNLNYAVEFTEEAAASDTAFRRYQVLSFSQQYPTLTLYSQKISNEFYHHTYFVGGGSEQNRPLFDHTFNSFIQIIASYLALPSL